jgi:hypothetical protein
MLKSPLFDKTRLLLFHRIQGGQKARRMLNRRINKHVLFSGGYSFSAKRIETFRAGEFSMDGPGRGPGNGHYSSNLQCGNVIRLLGLFSFTAEFWVCVSPKLPRKSQFAIAESPKICAASKIKRSRWETPFSDGRDWNSGGGA